MKKILTIILLLAFVLPVVGQTDNIVTENSKKGAHLLNIHVIGLEYIYTYPINRKLSIGGGIGGGAIISLIIEEINNTKTFQGGPLDIIRGKVFIQYNLSKYLYFNAGVKTTYSIISYDSYGSAIAPSLGIFLNGGLLRLGVEFSLVVGSTTTDNLPLFTISFPILGIRLNKKQKKHEKNNPY
ncbi:MAG: hypothetical protein CVT95_09980 [Bacteroidetes bacterium HGW-Bacteroidetes-12]|nr:MAG: hypothetical protein CVT95_09980 [Bacteroidetes bacterium HGW-Bacteroidetes-12]